MRVEAEFLPKLRFLFKPAPYKVAYSGRGAGKSWGYARALLIHAAQRRLRVLCARELQISIKESVHELLARQIELLGMSSVYSVLQTEIRGANGSHFVFAGLRHNVTKIKSMEDVDICWVEEAETVSEESWNVLIPTIRKRESEIWVSFNPDQESDPTYKRFITDPPDGAVVVELNWRDNPWLSARSLADKDYLYRVDPEAAEWIWGGKPRTHSKAQILAGKWVVEAFESQPGWHGPYQGADWGFAVDPSALIRCWVSGDERSLERELWIEHEAYGVGVDINETPELFDSIPKAREYVTRADNARPETISHMQQHGYPKITGVEKWSGSVEDGISHLRSYSRIVIHPRCQHTIDEARLYAYKTDRLSGDVLPVVIDKHNHCIDALRYALAPLIRHRITAINPLIRQAEQRNPFRV